MTTIPTLSAYSGEFPDRQVQDRDTFASNIYSYISWVGTLFATSFNVVAEKLNLLSGEINLAKDEVETNRNYVASAKDSIEATMGATFTGDWNNADDFTNKTVVFNGAIWVGLQSAIGETPTQNENWVLVRYIENVRSVTADCTAVMGDVLEISTLNNTVNITFPTPVHGGRVTILDKDLNFETNNVNITLVNALYYGQATTIELVDNTSSFTFVCVEHTDGTFTWRIK